MSRYALLSLLALALVFLPVLPASATAFRVESPDKNTIGIGGDITNRVIRYDPKRKELNASLTIDYSRYATSGGLTKEDLFFTFPKVAFDPVTKILSVVPPSGGEAVPIGEWKEGSLGGHAVLLYETSVFVTSRDRTAIRLFLDVDTERTAEAMKKKAAVEESQPVEEKLK
ncbi:hypothetical protein SAMN05444156_1087 [Verrucomicrobium sp. GAS474]|uniref:hypothetical protein n=1 Tax=Verrucomicrobium sp. GAS474 TaxID=1882831 RepID=UPI00087A7E23|nr:hypothetical protein [Verrucomicrobium sp. GAS474]SDT96138.1 hypothetical protein SAMN05444156_1087 [Verrucomicrobium sp. GAS474]